MPPISGGLDIFTEVFPTVREILNPKARKIEKGPELWDLELSGIKNYFTI